MPYRLFTQNQIDELLALPGVTPTTKDALKNGVNGETLFMGDVVEAWNARAETMNLPSTGLKTELDRVAFMDGVITTFALLEAIPDERREAIAILAITGRLKEYMDGKQLP